MTVKCVALFTVSSTYICLFCVSFVMFPGVCLFSNAFYLTHTVIPVGVQDRAGVCVRMR